MRPKNTGLGLPDYVATAAASCNFSMLSCKIVAVLIHVRKQERSKRSKHKGLPVLLGAAHLQTFARQKKKVTEKVYTNLAHGRNQKRDTSNQWQLKVFLLKSIK